MTDISMVLSEKISLASRFVTFSLVGVARTSMTSTWWMFIYIRSVQIGVDHDARCFYTQV